MSLTPEQRSLVARAAAHSSWAKTPDRSARTAPARAVAAGRWERQVDPHGLMTDEDRARCAESAKNAHMTRMSLASSQARRKKSRGDGA